MSTARRNPKIRKTKIQHLYLEQFLGWAIAWLVGIGCLFAVAALTHSRLSQQDLDGELSLYATAVYGLGWFDEDGRFRDDLLLQEPDLLDGPFDLWVIEPETPALMHLKPQKPRFQIASLPGIAKRIFETEPENYFLDGLDEQGLPYRLHGATHYDDDGSIRAAILVVADPTPWNRTHRRFIAETGLVVAFLSLIGLLVGAALSRRSLRPVLTSLEQQERFLAAAAHELRTPVASLRAVCDSARSGEESASAALDRISGLTLRTSHLVDQLLLLARLDAGSSIHRQLVRLDLLAEALMPEDDSITFQAEESVVEAEPALLETALRNLIENAQVHGIVADGRAKIQVTVKGQEVRVEDEGPGFPPAFLKQAMEPFVARPGSPGTGLGLAIVKLIAERHEGSLILENRRNGGARTVLHLGSGSGV